MADPSTFELVTGAGLSLLVLEKVFGFIKPLIPALNGQGDGDGKVTLALLGYRMSRMEKTVERIDSTVQAIDKKVSG